MKNRALIDTDILSYYFKGERNVLRNFEKYLETFEIIELSIITYYEILSGLQAKNAFRQLEIFEEFAKDNIVIPLTENSCKISAELYSNLKQKGELIDDIDLLIAGIAIENEMTIVTNNEKHFQRIPGLKIENWAHGL
ncbi:MAG: type II toxin-antitoxin system VapC family toxin [Bacteroidales bacterium]|nr:type II toxin-antitoxin system VapC family toxin [Bacteroidales bacterium]MBS3774044.1 type II toxin-antitoxin system VapC family toxin [Bacteroidales bacterium]